MDQTLNDARLTRLERESKRGWQGVAGGGKKTRSAEAKRVARGVLPGDFMPPSNRIFRSVWWYLQSGGFSHQPLRLDGSPCKRLGADIWE